jgi:hypothetical protein
MALRHVHDWRQGRRADLAEQREHLLAFDQRTRLFACTSRVGTVVPVDQDEPVPVHAALGVDAGDARLRTARVQTGEPSGMTRPIVIGGGGDADLLGQRLARTRTD